MYREKSPCTGSPLSDGFSGGQQNNKENTTPSIPYYNKSVTPII